MSQFNSIFSPLTNKLARLAGINLLAVAALFASTQQIAAQGTPGGPGTNTCVTSLEVRVGDNCQATVTVPMVMLGATLGTEVIRINDLNPTNGGIIDGVSPASGWVYGVYSGTTLLCTGVIYAVDYTAPRITALNWNGGVTGTTATDTLLCVDINDVLNESKSRTVSTDNHYYTGSITSANTDNCGGLVQTKVTDRVDYTDCATNNVFATITRTFQAIDQRGNDTTLTQLISFVRPMPSKLNIRGANSRAAKTTINGQAVFATNPASGVFTSINNAYLNTPSTATAPNMIIFNKCTGIPSTKDELKAYLKSLYTYTYTIGNSKTDSISFFDNPCNYSADFTYTTFDNCNGGKKFMVTTSIVDWCNSANSITDYVVLSFEDKSAPVFAADNSNLAIASSDKAAIAAGDTAIISVGTNDCTASLRLGTSAAMRDLKDIFNLKVGDLCGATTLNYTVQTKNYYNNTFFVDQGWTTTNYTIVNMGSGLNVVGLPVGTHNVKIVAHDACNNKDSITLYFKVVDKVAPVMKCDDALTVSLTSNSSSNYFIDLNKSDADLSRQMQARLYVADINEGSRDNCVLDSLYVRRQFDAGCLDYFAQNMEYDIYGLTPNGKVELNDFERVGPVGSTTYLTPKFMQYVDFFCCDPSSVMVELWGADGRHYNNGLAGNWNYCWTNVTIEDKTSPVITIPDLNKTYNASARNWMNCTDKEWLQGPNLPKTNVTALSVNNNLDNTVYGKIATVKSANDQFGIPDVYGIECSGDLFYEVKKYLTCDTGYIDRIWTVEKTVKGVLVSKSVTQRIWVQASHDYTITVPADITGDCPSAGSSTTAPSWNENGCDLLAMSAARETVYDAKNPQDNACKKIYKTWTIINWCQVPNEFNCSSADPMNFARVIPRLVRTTVGGTGDDKNNYVYTAPAANELAQSILHRFRKVVSSTSRIKGDNLVSPSSTGVLARPDATNTNPLEVKKAFSSALVANVTGVPGSSSTNNTWNKIGWTTDDKATYLESNIPSTTCTNYNQRTFAWTYTQVIKVVDISKPTIDTDVATGLKFKHADAGASDEVNWDAAKKVFGIRGNAAESTSPSINGSECKALVKFTFDVSDGCAASGPFNVESGAYIVKKTSPLSTTSVAAATVTPADPGQRNKTFDVSVDGLGIDATTGKQDYQLVVSVRDDCGNVTTDRIDFTVADIKAPAPVCVQNLTVSLMPTNAGGSPNSGMTVIKAIDVFQDINRNWGDEECTPTVKAKIVRTANDKATDAAGVLAYNDTIVATCNDRGGIAARVYLIDGAGNYNYCSIIIVVEDNASICGSIGSASVAGLIQTEGKTEVEGVQVNLSGESQKQMATGVNGRYVFQNLNNGMDYTVTPSLNKGFLNGVSTYDLILISKHILGTQPLNTPYKRIAADVNNSKSITTLDMIQLRKLILNIDASFPSNSSWRFVDAAYTFPNAANPWEASFPEVKNVNDLEGALSANFVAIKVGDVNGNAIANSTQGSVRHLTSNLGINVSDMNLVAGNEYKVDFTAADLNGIEGFQFTLNLDKKGLELVDLVPGIAAEENFGIFAEEGVITASWNGEAKGGVLFSLVVRAKSNTTLSEVLNLNSRYTAAEAYKGGEVVNVGLNFNASKASANYELYQNTPNPFTGETIIGFNLPAAGAATLTIQDVTGRTLKVINGQYGKGYNQVSLKSSELSATGVLTYTLKAADYTMTRKMIVVE